MKLLLPIDASPYTRDAVAYLKRLRPSLAGTPRLVCLHVTYGVTPTADLPLVEQARDVLREDDLAFGPEKIVAELNEAGYDAVLQLDDGDPAEAIIRYGNQADLVVMGSHGRGAVKQAVMGSVATQVLAEGKTPVLLVK